MSELSNARSLICRMGARRFLDVSPDELRKIGDIIQTIVRYHYPRSILLTDILEIIDELDPRFVSHFVITVDTTYSTFLQQFCPYVTVFGSSSNPSLVWKEMDA